MHLKNLGKFLEKTLVGAVIFALSFNVFVFTGFTGILRAEAATGVPTIVAYQGRLTDGSGTLLGSTSGTTYYFKFSIWDNATVSSGSKVWPASAPGVATSSVATGVFNVNIGDTAAGFPDTLDYNFQDNRDVYLQVEVSSDNATYETLSPRQRITAAGFAVNSGTVLGFAPSQTPSGSNIPVLNSGNLLLAGTNPQINASGTNALVLQGGAGTGSIQFFNASNTLSSTGNLTIAGILNVPTASTTIGGVAYHWPSGDGFSGYVLTTNGAGELSWTAAAGGGGGDSNWLLAGSSLVTSSTVTKVGIATTNPSSTLHVVGSAIITGPTTLAAASSTNFTVSSSFTSNGSSALQDVTFANATSSGNLQVATVTVTGKSTLANVSSTALTVSGATNLNTLNVSGASSLAGVSATNVSSTNITASGFINGGSLVITGGSVVANVSSTNLTASGFANVGSLVTSGSATVSGTSTLAGVSASYVTVSGNEQIGGSLTVTGTSTLANVSSTGLTVSGNTNLATTTVSNLTITGGLTLPTNSVGANELQSTTVAAGSYGSANSVPVFTVDADGRLTAASTSSIAIAASQITSGVLGIANGGTNASTLGATGTIAYSSGSAYAFIGPGSSNQILTSGGGSTPSFQNVASLLTQGSNISITGTTNATIAVSATPSFTTLTVTNTSTLANVSSTALTVSGATNLNTLNVSGASSLGGLSATNVSSTNITASGFGNLGSLAVSGASALNSLSVTATSTLAGISGSFLAISGNSMLTNASSTNFSASGFANLGSLQVSGSSTLAGVSGSYIVSSGALQGASLAVSGTSTLAGVAGSYIVSTGAVQAASLSASGTSTLAGTSVSFLSNSGASMLQGVSSTNVSASGFVNVGSLSVSGASILSGALTATSATSTFAGVSGSYIVASGALQGGSLAISGTSTLAGIAGSYLGLTGSQTLGGQLVASSGISAATSTITGTSTLAGVSASYVVSAGALQGNSASIAGSATVGGQVTVTSGISAATSTITGTSTLAGVSASFINNSGNSMLQGVSSTNVTASGFGNFGSLQVSGGVSVTGTSTSGGVSTGFIANSGASMLQGVSSTNVTASGFVNANSLAIAGTSTLAGVSGSYLLSSGAVQAASLSLSGSATIGGQVTATSGISAATSTITGTSTLAGVSASYINTSGNLQSGGALAVTGTSTLAGTSHTFISVSGSSMLQGVSSTNVSASGFINGASLSIAGATILSGSLTASSATSTFAGVSASYLLSSGAVQGGSLAITGTSTLAGISGSYAGITGNATIGGQLVVSSGINASTSTIANVSSTNVTASGFVNAGSLQVSGASTFGSLSTTGTSTSGGVSTGFIANSGASILQGVSSTNVSASGFVNAGNLSVSGASILSGALTASSATSTFAGISGSFLTISGNTMLTGVSSTNISASGYANLGSLQVAGTSTLAGVSGSYIVATGAVQGGSLSISGTSTLAGVSASYANISGNEQVGGTLDVTGKTTLANVSSTALTVSSQTVLATTTALGLSVTANGITLASSTPVATTNTLYNLGGSLYFNGASVTSGGSAASGTAGLIQFSNGAGALNANALFNWDNATNALALGTSAVASSTLHVVGGATVTGTSTLAGISGTFLANSGASMLQGVSSTNVSASGFVNAGSLTVSGASNLATTTVIGLTSSANGVVIASSSPFTTSNALYNLGGNLYFNGSLLGVAGAGLQSVNGLSTTTQFLVVGNSGTDFNIVSSVNTHTFNIPDASATNRGLVTTSTQTLAGDKTFSGAVTVNGSSSLAGISGSYLGITGNQTLGGQLSVGSGISATTSTITGTSSLAGVSASFISNSGASMLQGVSSTNITASGFVNAGSLQAGSITVTGTSTLAGLAATYLGLTGNATVSGQAILTSGITVATSTVTGTSTLAGVTATFLANSGASMLQGVSSTNLSASGYINGASLAISGATVLGGALTATSATSTLAGISASFLANSGNTMLTGTLNVAATSTLATTTAPAVITGFAGVPGGVVSGMIWYDSTAAKYKINEGGVTKTICNETDLACGTGGASTDTNWTLASNVLTSTTTAFTIGIGTSTISTIFAISSSTPAITLNDTTAAGHQFRLRNGVAQLGFFDIFDNSSNTSRLVIDNTGSVGIGTGTNTPSSTLHVVGTFQVSGTSTLAGPTFIDDLNLGMTSFDTNAGIVTWIDLPVTSASATGTVHSYTAKLDDSDLLTVYGQSNGAGGTMSEGVAIGTSTPAGLFTVATATSSPSAPFLNITRAGLVGIGTSTPTSTLQVAGAIRSGTGGGVAGSLILHNGSNAFTTTLQASSSVASNITLTLPNATGTAGQTMLSDGSGNLYWGTAAGSASASGTAGLVQFSDGSGNLDANSLFYWNNTSSTLSLGTSARASSTLHVVGTFQVTATSTFGGPVIPSADGTISLGTGTAEFNEAYIKALQVGTTGYVTSGFRLQTEGHGTTVGDNGGGGGVYTNSGGSAGLGTRIAWWGPDGFAGSNAGIGADTAGMTVGFFTAGVGWTSGMTKSSLAGGNLSLKYDGIEAQRISQTGMNIATSTLVGNIAWTPSSTLHVIGDFTVTATSTLQGQTIIDNLVLGATTFEADAGQLTWTDLPIVSAANNTVESYTAAIDGNTLLTVYGESDGSGSLKNGRVGIGTSTPTTFLTVGTSTNLFNVTEQGYVGVGTSSPASLFAVGGSATISGQAILTSGLFAASSTITGTTTIGTSGTYTTVGSSAAASSTLHVVGTFQVTGTSTLATTTVAGITATNNGLTLSDSTPINTTNAVYNVGGTLYWNGAPLGAGSGYGTIQEEGSGLTARSIVNFIGSAVTCVDNSGSSRTDCTITGGASTDTNWTLASNVLTSTTTAFTIGIGTSTASTIFAISSSTPAITLNDTTAAGHQFRLRNGVASVGTFDIYDNSSSSARLSISGAGVVTIASTTIISGALTASSATSTFAGVSGSYLLSSGAVQAASLTTSGNATVNGTVYTGAMTSNGSGITLTSTNGDLFFYQNSGSGSTALFQNSNAAGIPLTVTGQGGQTGNLQNWNGNGGSAYVAANGSIVMNGLSSSGTSTIGTSGTYTTIGSSAAASSTLHVVGDFTVTATSTLQGQTTIDNLVVGAASFDTDAGIVTWTDLPISSSAATSTVESYIAQIDGNALLSLYAQANGSGGTKNEGVAIGTSTPQGLFTVATATSTAIAPILNITRAGLVGIGTAVPSTTLHVVGGGVQIGSGTVSFANAPLNIIGSVAGYLQTNIQNTSNATSASADYIATADNGTDSTYYIDFGINSSAYNQSAYNIGGANDGYLYVHGGDLTIGTASSTTGNSDIIFHTGGTTSSNEKMRIGLDGKVGIGTSAPTNLLHVAGGITISSTTPASTTNALYNNGGTLYWNGSAVGTKADHQFDLKTGDENVPSGTTLQDDDELAVAVGANETWVFQFNLRASNANSATPDFKAALKGLAGWTCAGMQWIRGASAAAGAAAAYADCDDAPTAVVNAAVLADANANFNVIIQGTVTASSTAGSLILQWAPNTSGSLSVLKGSFVEAFRVGGSGADLAEIYYSKSPTLEAGSLVSLDPTAEAFVQPSISAYDPKLIGVVSTRPGVLLGEKDTPKDSRPVYVGLAGRVPTKVSIENGPIQPGDYITASSIPGVGMRATKAGTVIGQAITGFDGPDVGKVIVFLKSGYYAGGQDNLVQSAGDDFGLATLSKLLTDRSLGEAASSSLSVIATDRLIAGLEVIAPRVLTSELVTDTLAPRTADLAVQLAGDQRFSINSLGASSTTSSTPMISFDAHGNAAFAGKITADSIDAKKISGLEILTDKLSSLSDAVSDLSEQSTSTPAALFAGLTLDAFTAYASGTKALLGEFASSTAASFADTNSRLEGLEGTLKLLQDSTAGVATTSENLAQRLGLLEGLFVAGNSSTTQFSVSSTNIGTSSLDRIITMQGALMIDRIGAGSADLLSLISDVQFFGRPYFTADTAGFAVIPERARSVEVVFDREYLEQPIVNATISLEDGTPTDPGATANVIDRVFSRNVQYLVARKSTTGFTIVLNQDAPLDLRFSWTAFAVKNAKTFMPKVNAIEVSPPTPPVVIPVEIPDANPAPVTGTTTTESVATTDSDAVTTTTETLSPDSATTDGSTSTSEMTPLALTAIESTSTPTSTDVVQPTVVEVPPPVEAQPDASSTVVTEQ